MNLSLKELLKIPGSHLEFAGGRNLLARKVAGVSIDSRTIQPDEIYFALGGEKHDGHDFLDEVFARQALAAVVGEKWWQARQEHGRDWPLIVVPDTLLALQQTAHAYRKKFHLPILALTGTNGKTTTKEMIAAVLATAGPVCKTESNLNNHIGLPLTLFRLWSGHKHAVLEMGTNHFGEIARLCELAEPEYGLITNIGHGHTEFLGSLEGVAKAKMELFEFLRQNDGTAFINIDDPLIAQHVPELRNKITYGFREEADVFGEKAGLDESGLPLLRVRGMLFRINLPGSHNLGNALAAIAVGSEFGIAPQRIGEALQQVTVPGKRMELLQKGGVLILNDCYNANPESTLAALQTLHELPQKGRRILVFGDMLELGERSETEHARIGKALAGFGVEVLLAYGEVSRAAVAAARAAGKIEARHFIEKKELAAALKAMLQSGDMVLIKGSRGMKMEEVLEQII